MRSGMNSENPMWRRPSTSRRNSSMCSWTLEPNNLRHATAQSAVREQ
jgi:hypothetical protein